MRSKLKYSLYGLILLIILIQLVPVQRDNPLSDEKLEIAAPLEVKKILENSCYDCHSNETNWPFYSYVAPISWLVVRDVQKGREELNFSQWLKLPPQKRDKIKERMIKEISGNDMPLPIYLIIHPNAELNDQQKQIMKNWVLGNNND